MDQIEAILEEQERLNLFWDKVDKHRDYLMSSEFTPTENDNCPRWRE